MTGPIEMAITRWAQAEPSVVTLALIGSQVRSVERNEILPDGYSDWDFQIITTTPDVFVESSWCVGLGLGVPVAYVARRGRLGSSLKVTALFEETAIDVVVIPSNQARQLEGAIAEGRYLDHPAMREALFDQSAVLRNGYRFLKGTEQYETLFRFIATEIPLRRLNDDAIRELAEGFVCDYVSTRNKIGRGELLAAQRWLHHELAETNFRLLHELQLREGNPTQPDARRLETLAGSEWVEHLAISAIPTVASLEAAIEKSRATLCLLLHRLIGARWRWPDLPTPAR